VYDSDYIEQISWILFLKYLDDLENDKETSAALSGTPYTSLFRSTFRWQSWAAPKTADGKIDHHKSLTGDDLKDFVDHDLYPYLKSSKNPQGAHQPLSTRLMRFFSELKNKIQSGYNLREVIDRIDELRFGTNAEKHEMFHLYESKIKNMGNAGRNGGAYGSFLWLPSLRVSMLRLLSERCVHW
jgi:type I restriction enzyme M protein